jgi:hypothetical protein
MHLAVTATDVQLFRPWHDLAPLPPKGRKGGSEANNPLIISLKNAFIYIFSSHVLNTVFVYEIFLFDTVLYFLHNLIIS